ncbi:MAG: pre-peptidase C-terminal domain-containing protein, partial [Gammaproteobacteria bacterium]|nr:pre-peptidase C-terminal domain-containing protein [Gammaproteobacteria bacterium]
VGDAAYLFHDIKAAETDKSYYYASSEAAVSNILWNILETTSLGMSQIWDVLVNYFPTSERPTSLPVFWDGLLASDLYDPNELPALNAIFEARDVYYSSDANEDNNTIATATVQAVGVTPAVTSTIYSDTLVADVDFVEFTGVAGKTYNISTSDLYNGIDTKIRLFDKDGMLLAENDDADPSAYYRYDADVYDWRVLNNTTAMSSSLDVTLSTDGQYYVEVSFADKQNTTYDFVGHYGSYKLNITEVN